MTRKDKEDVYDIKRPSAGLYILLVIIVVVVLAFSFTWMAEKPVQKKAFVDMCENMMLQSKSNYTVCCVNSDEISDCTAQKSFGYNDYIIVQTNIMAFNELFPVYYACAFYTPLETTFESINNDTMAEISVGDETAICTKRLTNVYHHLENFGVIKNRGKITLMRLYIFPPLGFNTTQDFVNNIDRGMFVLNMTAKVM